MARYIGPVCRLCRREAMKLFLKGERCYTEKCAIEKRNFPPGQHGKTRKAKLAGYGLQLREKQKVKRIYGVLENQFRGYFETAERARGITGVTLLQLLERRLDNVVYRLGLSTSRPQARQLVRHGHFLVNGKKVDIPSFQVKEGDVITVLGRTQKNPTIEHAMEEVKGRGIPEWLSFDTDDDHRPRQRDADARADQPAGAGTADRRAVLEVSQKAEVRSLTPVLQTSYSNFLVIRRPAAFSDLRREVGGQLQVWRPVCGPDAKGHQNALERFSATQAARVRARDAHGSIRPVLRAAVRARLRHDHRQRAAPRAAVVD